jgi:alkylation response protein AidB-like acyl-CoA dehydrogenase
MKPNLTFEESEVQKSVKKFVKNELLPFSGIIEEHGELPLDIKKKFLSMELLKTPFPDSEGRGSFLAFVIALKELCYASLVPGWLLLENFMAAYPLFFYGSDNLKSKYLHDLISLKTTGAFAFTEDNTGSDPAQIETYAEEKDNGWIINGSKRFITHSKTCDNMVLFAKTDKDNITAFLINSKNKGYKHGVRERFIHTSSLDNGELYLKNYFADHEHVIGEPGQGFEILLKTEEIGKIGFSAFFTGAAKRAIDLSLEFANKRLHRGIPIGKKFQMIQAKLACMITKYNSVNSCLFDTASKALKEKNTGPASAALKLLAAENIKDITSDAMAIHGAYGLSREYEIERIYRTAIIAQSVMGNSDIQKVIIAKHALRKGSL